MSAMDQEHVVVEAALDEAAKARRRPADDYDWSAFDAEAAETAAFMQERNRALQRAFMEAAGLPVAEEAAS